MPKKLTRTVTVEGGSSPPKKKFKATKASNDVLMKKMLRVAETKSIIDTGGAWIVADQAKEVQLCTTMAQGTTGNTRLGRKIAVMGFRVMFNFDNTTVTSYNQSIRVEIIKTQRRESPLAIYFNGNDANRTSIAYDTSTIPSYLRHIQDVNRTDLLRLASKQFTVAGTQALGSGPKAISETFYVPLKKPIVIEFEPNDSFTHPQLWMVVTAANPQQSGTATASLAGIAYCRTYYKDV